MYEWCRHCQEAGHKTEKPCDMQEFNAESVKGFKGSLAEGAKSETCKMC